VAITKAGPKTAAWCPSVGNEHQLKQGEQRQRDPQGGVPDADLQPQALGRKSLRTKHAQARFGREHLQQALHRST